MKNISFKVENQGQALAVFAVAASLRLPIYSGTEKGFSDNFDAEVSEFKYINFNGTRISSSRGTGVYSPLTFGNFIQRVSEIASRTIRLNGSYEAIVRDGSIEVSGNPISIELVQEILGLVGERRTIKERDAVVIKNDKEMALIRVVAAQYGIEVGTLSDSFKEIIYMGDEGNYLAGNPQKSNNSYNYISLAKFLTGLVTKQGGVVEILGYNATATVDGQRIEIGCQTFQVETIQKVVDTYNKLTSK